jgi:tetratricopeptide (TPR) repeat protein
MLVYNYRGLTFDRAGEYRRALGEYEAQLEIARAAASAEPGDVQATIGVAIAEGDVGIETARLGRPRVGLAEITDAIATGERLLAANPSELFYADLLTVAYAYQAETLSSIGRHMEAAAKYAEALRRATDVSRADPDDLESPLSIAKIHAALGAVLGRAQRYADASKEVEAARGDLARLQHRRPADAEAAYVAALNDANGIALRNCRDHRPCAAGTLQLPSLLN